MGRSKPHRILGKTLLAGGHLVPSLWVSLVEGITVKGRRGPGYVGPGRTHDSSCNGKPLEDFERERMGFFMFGLLRQSTCLQKE